MQLKLIVFLASLFFYFSVWSQEIKITIKGGKRPLDEVLAEVTSKTGYNFGYDATIFGKIIFSGRYKNVTLSEFLKILENGYRINAKNIDNTWVLYQTSPVRSIEKPVFNFETIRKNEIKDARKIRVSGFVKDAKTGENLLYCSVFLNDNVIVATNDLGFYSVEVPNTEKVRIRVSYLGYLKIDTVLSSRIIPVFQLQPHDIMIDPIKVNPEKNLLEAAPQNDKIGFNPLRTSYIPRVSNDDMANAFLVSPGIDFLQGGSAGISIRGGYPSDNLILFDGIPVLEATHLFGNMSVLNSKYVQQAYVSRGGFDAEFSGRVAGLIELVGKSGKNNSAYLDVSANLLNSNLLLNLPLTNKLSVTAAWRRSFVDMWQNYIYVRLVDNVSEGANNSIESTIYPQIRYQDFNAKVSFHPSENIELNLNYLYGSDDQNRDFKLIQSQDYYLNEFIKSRNYGLSLNCSWQASPAWHNYFSAGYSTLDKSETDETGELQTVTENVQIPLVWWLKASDYFFTQEETYSKYVYDIDNGRNAIEEYRLAWKTEFKKGEIRNQAGIGWTHDAFDYAYHTNRDKSQIKFDSLVNHGNQYLLNLFVQQHIPLDENVTLRWGMVANVDLATSRKYFQPRFGLEYNPGKDINIYYLNGIYDQFLSRVKRIDGQGNINQVWFLPNRYGKGVVRADHNVFGFKYSKSGWFFNVEAYMRNTRNKTNHLAVKTPTGVDYVYYYFEKESREKIRGLDFFAEKKQEYFHHILSFSYSNSYEKLESIYEGKWFPSNNHRTTDLKLTEIVTWKNWSMTGMWHLGSGLPVLNYANPENILVDKTSYFSQLDFGLVRKFTARHFYSIIGLSVLNVFDRKNIIEVDFLRFSSKTGSLSLRSDVSSLGLTPLFYASFKFW